MRRGYIVVIFFIVICVGFGLSKKTSNTDITHDDTYLDGMLVAEVPEEIGMEMLSDWEGYLDEAPFVVQVTAVGAPIHTFKATLQAVRIEHVIKGEQSLEGMELMITSHHWKLITDFSEVRAERGFTNFLDVGMEYLLFLEEEDLSNKKGVSVYSLYDENNIFAPAFSVREHTNTVIPTSSSSTYVPYKIVCGNEFFTNSEKVLEKYLEIKRRIVNQYL